MDGTSSQFFLADTFFCPCREEPETIKKWRAEQEKRLEEKDAKESDMMEELREKAKKELHDWFVRGSAKKNSSFKPYLSFLRYKKYDEQLEKTKGDNRSSEKTFVAQMDKIEPGTEWERVNKLCEFNAKKQNSAKDMSRMRWGSRRQLAHFFQLIYFSKD